MAGLCEAGNEPSSSLEASKKVSSVRLMGLQPHANIMMQFGAEHSPAPCSSSATDSAKIDGQTYLGIEVPRGADHRNILLHKIGSYLTVVMKALASSVEPHQDQDGSSTHLDFHVNAELKDPQGHVSVTDTHSDDCEGQNNREGPPPVINWHLNPAAQIQPHSRFEHPLHYHWYPFNTEWSRQSPSSPEIIDQKQSPTEILTTNSPTETPNLPSKITQLKTTAGTPTVNILNQTPEKPSSATGIHQLTPPISGVHPWQVESHYSIGHLPLSVPKYPHKITSVSEEGTHSGSGGIAWTGNGGLFTEDENIANERSTVTSSSDPLPSVAGLLSGTGDILGTDNDSPLSEVGDTVNSIAAIGTASQSLSDVGDVLGTSDPADPVSSVGGLLSGTGDILDTDNDSPLSEVGDIVNGVAALGTASQSLSDVGDVLGTSDPGDPAPSVGGLLSGTGDILGTDNDSPLSEVGDIVNTVAAIGTASQSLSDAGDVLGTSNDGLLSSDPSPSGLNVLGTVGGLLSDVGNVLGTSNGGLLSGNTSPTGLNVLGTVGGLLSDVEDILGTSNGGLLSSEIPVLPSDLNILGTADNLLSGTGDIIGKSNESLNSNHQLSSALKALAAAGSLGTLDRIVPSGGQLLHLDLSLPSSQVVPIPLTEHNNKDFLKEYKPNPQKHSAYEDKLHGIEKDYSISADDLLPTNGKASEMVWSGLPSGNNEILHLDISLPASQNSLTLLNQLLNLNSNSLQNLINLSGEQELGQSLSNENVIKELDVINLDSNEEDDEIGDIGISDITVVEIDDHPQTLLRSEQPETSHTNTAATRELSTEELTPPIVHSISNIVPIPKFNTVSSLHNPVTGAFVSKEDEVVNLNIPVQYNTNNIVISYPDDKIVSSSVEHATHVIPISSEISEIEFETPCSDDVETEKELVILPDATSPSTLRNHQTYLLTHNSQLPINPTSINNQNPIYEGVSWNTDDKSSNSHISSIHPWSSNHIVHTVESKTPLISTDNPSIKSYYHIEKSESPVSLLERHKVAASSSDKITTNIESVKSTKINPFNSLTKLEVVKTNTVHDSRPKSDIKLPSPIFDNSYQHSIKSTSKFRSNGYQLHQPDGELQKYLYYKHFSRNRDRSLDSHEVTNEMNVINNYPKSNAEYEVHTGTETDSYKFIQPVEHSGLVEYVNEEKLKSNTEETDQIEHLKSVMNYFGTKGKSFQKEELKYGIRSDRMLDDDISEEKKDYFIQQPSNEYVTDDDTYRSATLAIPIEEIYMRSPLEEKELLVDRDTVHHHIHKQEDYGNADNEYSLKSNDMLLKNLDIIPSLHQQDVDVRTENEMYFGPPDYHQNIIPSMSHKMATYGAPESEGLYDIPLSSNYRILEDSDHSNILIPGRASDVGTSAFETITFLPGFTDSFIPETTYTPLIYRSNHESFVPESADDTYINTERNIVTSGEVENKDFIMPVYSGEMYYGTHDLEPQTSYNQDVSQQTNMDHGVNSSIEGDIPLQHMTLVDQLNSLQENNETRFNETRQELLTTELQSFEKDAKKTSEVNATEVNLGENHNSKVYSHAVSHDGESVGSPQIGINTINKPTPKFRSIDYHSNSYHVESPHSTVDKLKSTFHLDDQNVHHSNNMKSETLHSVDFTQGNHLHSPLHQKEYPESDLQFGHEFHSKYRENPGLPEENSQFISAVTQEDVNRSEHVLALKTVTENIPSSESYEYDREKFSLQSHPHSSDMKTVSPLHESHKHFPESITNYESHPYLSPLNFHIENDPSQNYETGIHLNSNHNLQNSQEFQEPLNNRNDETLEFKTDMHLTPTHQTPAIHSDLQLNSDISYSSERHVPVTPKREIYVPVPLPNDSHKLESETGEVPVLEDEVNSHLFFHTSPSSEVYTTGGQQFFLKGALSTQDIISDSQVEENDSYEQRSIETSTTKSENESDFLEESQFSESFVKSNAEYQEPKPAQNSYEQNKSPFLKMNDDFEGVKKQEISPFEIDEFSIKTKNKKYHPTLEDSDETHLESGSSEIQSKISPTSHEKFQSEQAEVYSLHTLLHNGGLSSEKLDLPKGEYSISSEHRVVTASQPDTKLYSSLETYSPNPWNDNLEGSHILKSGVSHDIELHTPSNPHLSGLLHEEEKPRASGEIYSHIQTSDLAESHDIPSHDAYNSFDKLPTHKKSVHLSPSFSYPTSLEYNPIILPYHEPSGFLGSLHSGIEGEKLVYKQEITGSEDGIHSLSKEIGIGRKNLMHHYKNHDILLPRLEVHTSSEIEKEDILPQKALHLEEISHMPPNIANEETEASNHKIVPRIITHHTFREDSDLDFDNKGKHYKLVPKVSIGEGNEAPVLDVNIDNLSQTSDTPTSLLFGVQEEKIINFQNKENNNDTHVKSFHDSLEESESNIPTRFEISDHHILSQYGPRVQQTTERTITSSPETYVTTRSTWPKRNDEEIMRKENEKSRESFLRKLAITEPSDYVLGELPEQYSTQNSYHTTVYPVTLLSDTEHEFLLNGPLPNKISQIEYVNEVPITTLVSTENIETYPVGSQEIVYPISRMYEEIHSSAPLHHVDHHQTQTDVNFQTTHDVLTATTVPSIAEYIVSAHNNQPSYFDVGVKRALRSKISSPSYYDEQSRHHQAVEHNQQSNPEEERSSATIDTYKISQPYASSYHEVDRPIYVIQPAVSSRGDMSSSLGDSKVLSDHQKEGNMSPYHVMDHPHHVILREDELDLSKPLPVALAEKNALYDPDSGALVPYYGDVDRPRIICLTEQRDNLEILKSLRDDITKLKQKLNCE
ncbi:hypothetical protein ANN_00287 [Periplaneta americana]|uniref:Uncharacterized protein n=1 Tax=Periplaneta americana TaxID=6978 RepID=A0ABQ8TS03_PERAM|nr:hypothetical protein ANN_00287 [Periplaneta americana]